MGTSLMTAFTSPLPFFNQNRQTPTRFSITRVLFFLIICSIFANFGVWHLNQDALNALGQMRDENRHAETILLSELIEHQTDKDLSDYHIRLLGKFDNAHTVKVPVKNNSTNGFEVYVPFFIFGSEKLILVDRGFFSSLPSFDDVPPNFGQQEIQGILSKSFPHLIQVKMVSQITHQNYYDYVLIENFQSYFKNNTNTDPTKKLAKKEKAYAMIWFMFSAFFLMLCFLKMRNHGK